MIWLGVLLLASAGCAGMGKKNPVSASVAACRRFSCEGVTAMETGNLSEAEMLLRQAADASPKDADPRRHLAEALWARGAHADALNQMQAALRLQPNHAEAIVRHGEMLLATGRTEDAQQQAQRAMRLNPTSAPAWALRGRTFVAQGDLDRGLADFHHSLRHDPGNRGLLADLAELHRQGGRRQRELTTLHRLRDTYPPGAEPVELMAKEAAAYLAMGRTPQAVERLRLACAKENTSATLLYQLAEAEAAAGQPAQAVATAELALNADANHAPARQLLARLHGGSLR